MEGRTRRDFLKTSAAAAVSLVLPAWRLGAEETMSCGVVSHPISLEHDTGPGHPETAGRFRAVQEVIDGMTGLRPLPAREATEEEILRVHTAEYLRIVKRDVAEGRRQLSTGDTVISARSLDAANRAAGGTLNAVDAVFEGPVKRVFCAHRPPGHHAESNRGMGFCIWNPVALAARHAQAKHGVKRVLIVDWDVHHGNGTQEAFYGDDSVFFFSTHQWPWYPGTGAAGETGEGAGKGYTMNCPFPAGAGRKEILGVMEGNLRGAMRDYRPELVLISAGFDSRRGDPLGNFVLEDEDFADMTRLLREIAEDSAEGRVVSVLEGGYNLTGLAAGCRAHLGALAEV